MRGMLCSELRNPIPDLIFLFENAEPDRLGPALSECEAATPETTLPKQNIPPKFEITICSMFPLRIRIEALGTDV
jgi:hypothetical protein